MTYALTTTVDLPFDAALEATRAALADSGFGVVSEIDMQATFGTKLGADAATELGEFRILGACNPLLARAALRGEPDVGLLLPCNVVVRRGPHDTATTVQAIDPATMSDLGDSPALDEVATDAATRLRATLTLVTEQAAAQRLHEG